MPDVWNPNAPVLLGLEMLPSTGRAVAIDDVSRQELVGFTASNTTARTRLGLHGTVWGPILCDIVQRGNEVPGTPVKYTATTVVLDNYLNVTDEAGGTPTAADLTNPGDGSYVQGSTSGAFIQVHFSDLASVPSGKHYYAVRLNMQGSGTVKVTRRHAASWTVNIGTGGASVVWGEVWGDSSTLAVTWLTLADILTLDAAGGSYPDAPFTIESAGGAFTLDFLSVDVFYIPERRVAVGMIGADPFNQGAPLSGWHYTASGQFKVPDRTGAWSPTAATDYTAIVRVPTPGVPVEVLHLPPTFSLRHPSRAEPLVLPSNVGCDLPPVSFVGSDVPFYGPTRSYSRLAGLVPTIAFETGSFVTDADTTSPYSASVPFLVGGGSTCSDYRLPPSTQAYDDVSLWVCADLAPTAVLTVNLHTVAVSTVLVSATISAADVAAAIAAGAPTVTMPARSEVLGASEFSGTFVKVTKAFAITLTGGTQYQIDLSSSTTLAAPWFVAGEVVFDPRVEQFVPPAGIGDASWQGSTNGRFEGRYATGSGSVAAVGDYKAGDAQIVLTHRPSPVIGLAAAAATRTGNAFAFGATGIVTGGPAHPSRLPFLFPYTHLTWTASSNGARFSHYVIERSDALDATWRTVARLWTEADAAWSDIEGRLGVLTTYRVSVVAVDGAVSTGVTATITLAALACGLVIASNVADVGFALVDEVAGQREYAYGDSERASLHPVYGKTGQVVLRPATKVGVQFERTLTLSSGASPGVPLSMVVDSFKAAIDNPAVAYYAVRDEDGSRWQMSLIVTAVATVAAARRAAATVRFVESDATPAVVDVP